MPCVLWAVVPDPARDGFRSGNAATSVTNDSISLGDDNVADNGAITAGAGNTASNGSVAAGNDNEAYDKSISVGFGNWSVYGAAIGVDNDALGSQVLGSYNDFASTWGSVAVGNGNESVWATGSAIDNCLVGFFNSVFEQSNCTLVGHTNVALGDYSHALGRGLLAEGNCVTVGTYNDPNSSPTKTKKFVVGYGDQGGPRANALEVHDDGTVLINKRQGDISMGDFGN